VVKITLITLILTSVVGLDVNYRQTLRTIIECKIDAYSVAS